MKLTIQHHAFGDTRYYIDDKDVTLRLKTVDISFKNGVLPKRFVVKWKVIGTSHDTGLHYAPFIDVWWNGIWITVNLVEVANQAEIVRYTLKEGKHEIKRSYRGTEKTG